MDTGEIFRWVILFAVIFYYLLKNNKTAVEEPIENEEIREQLQEALKHIYSSWDIPALKLNFYREVTRFPKYKNLLTQASNQQFRLLEDFQRGHFYAVERVKAILRDRLEHCQSIQEFEALRESFGPMIEQSPPVANLFENYRLWFYRNDHDSQNQRREYRKHYKSKESRTNSKVPTQNLFSKCRNLDEVKQRFRKLAFQNHPDRGGKEAAMKEIIRQYEDAISNFK